VSLDLSRQYLFNDTDGIIIGVLVSLRDLFLSLFPCFSLSNFSTVFIVNRVSLSLEFKRVADDTCNSQSVTL